MVVCLICCGDVSGYVEELCVPSSGDPEADYEVSSNVR